MKISTQFKTIVSTLLTLLISVSIHANAHKNHDGKVCELPNDWDLLTLKSDATNKDNTEIAIEIDAKKIQISQPFSFKLAVCSNVDASSIRLKANAIMPAHQHGMNYHPKITKDDQSNRYLVEGFVFHMPGEWEITVSYYQDEKVSHHTKIITLN